MPALRADPFDRMLIARAIIRGIVILTPDPLIERHAVRVLR
jgi:PIN domain nuclease of toxin-antitoxin system